MVKHFVNFKVAFSIGIIIVILLSYFSLTNGIYEITLLQVLKAIIGMNVSDHVNLVIFNLRLPRIILAALIGLGLGISGAVFQGISKNGLADPGILGINSGAGCAIVLFMFFLQEQVTGAEWYVVLMMPLFGLIGGFVAACIIIFISREGNRLDPQRLILSGIAIGSGLGAITLFISLKMRANDFEMATVWLSGSIYSANWPFILSIIPWFIICLPIILRKSYILDLFQIKEESLISIGVSVEREKLILLFSSIGLVGACVSVAGSISFVGLMSPHIARLIIGNKHRHILPLCGLIGMTLVIGSDFLARTVVAPSEIPVGIVIAMIGVPYFVYLLFKVKE